MKDNVIKVISDIDFNLEKKELNNPRVRYASRGIIFNDLNEVAVINKKIKNEYKLPGGGIQELSKEDAFKREVLEETGCIIDITNYLGIIIEEKGQTNFKQISYVFVGKVIEDTKKLSLTEKEQDEQTIVLWKSLQDAYNLIKNSEKNLKGSKYDTKYQSLFMVRRDRYILEYYLKKILETQEIKPYNKKR